jgi:hypothetical protein
VQSLQAQLSVALAPLADGRARQPHPLGDGCVGFTGAAGQHDLGALHDRMRERSGIGEGLQLLNLVLGEDQRGHRTAKRHGAPRVTLPVLGGIYGMGD